MNNQKKRKIPKQCANPIFEQWLIQWKDEATENNSKLKFVYSKALQSLRRYPLLLSSGRECMILENFGQGICKRLDAKLQKEPNLIPNSNITGLPVEIDVISPYKKARKSPTKSSASSPSKSSSSTSEKSTSKTSSSKSSKPQRAFIPALRSAAYALLITLYKKEKTANYRGYMVKSELQRDAQQYSDAPLIATGRSNAWSSMARLVTKQLVHKMGNPSKYLLTEDGRKLAAKLVSAGGEAVDSHSTECSSNDNNIDLNVSRTERIHFQPSDFEIFLCVDTAETTAKSRREEIVGELSKFDVPVQIQKLHVGDFIWICSGISGARRVDLVLPYVVERKRSDDLASSIKDGRFHEQKKRLEETGLKVIYLAESYGSGDFGLAEGALNQALANTQVMNGFMIHETTSLKDTCSFLAHMTQIIRKKFEGKPVTSCTKEEWPTRKLDTENTYLLSFSDYNEFGTKNRNWTVSEMFARHIMKIRGLSNEKAYAIIQEYPTLQHLLRSYRQCSSQKHAEALISHIGFGTGTRCIGQALSRAIYTLYTSKSLQ